MARRSEDRQNRSCLSRDDTGFLQETEKFNVQKLHQIEQKARHHGLVIGREMSHLRKCFRVPAGKTSFATLAMSQGLEFTVVSYNLIFTAQGHKENAAKHHISATSSNSQSILFGPHRL